MKISLITVTYNSEAYLKDCIKSVLAQDYKNLEYIIIDGASTDSTLQIIESYKTKIAHFVSEPDKGIYDAINKGINLATGDIVGILNSDDMLSTSCVLTKVAEAFNVYNELQALFADVAFVERENSKKLVRYYSSKRFRPWMFQFGFQPAHPTFYAKRSVFEQYGVYRTDMKIAGDFELLVRFLAKGRINYKYLNLQLVTMRIGGISTSGLESIKRLNSEINKSLKINKIYSNKLFIYSKYLFKWWGYIFK